MSKRVAFAFTVMSVASIAAAQAQSEAPITYCSGPNGGNYAATGVLIKQQIPTHVNLVNTAGSLENLDKVANGDCQAGIVQSDALIVYAQTHPEALLKVERARDMYPEFGHLICNDSVSELSDLKRGNTVLVGAPGSGSAVMWDAITRANPKYKEVQTLPIGDKRALGKVSDGQDAQCMLFVSGLKSPAMMEANEQAKQSGGKLHLTYMRDSKLFDLKDAKGRQVYEKAEIPRGTYPYGLQQSGIFTSGASVSTVKVQSVLIDNVPYAESNERNLNAFLTGVNKAMPAINDRVLPK